MAVFLLCAVSLLACVAIGWIGRGHRDGATVDRLTALNEALRATVGEQQASLTAIPATEVEHRAAVAADHRRHLAERVARIDAYYLDQRAGADVVPLPVAPIWRAAA